MEGPSLALLVCKCMKSWQRVLVITPHLRDAVQQAVQVLILRQALPSMSPKIASHAGFDDPLM
jgi:hypothetical protein